MTENGVWSGSAQCILASEPIFVGRKKYILGAPKKPTISRYKKGCSGENYLIQQGYSKLPKKTNETIINVPILFKNYVCY